jgi:hypothetical protein
MFVFLLRREWVIGEGDGLLVLVCVVYRWLDAKLDLLNAITIQVTIVDFFLYVWRVRFEARSLSATPQVFRGV